MTRQSPPGGHESYPAVEASQSMTVRVRIQNPLPQGDGDHGDAGDPGPVVRTVRALPDESGYGHGV